MHRGIFIIAMQMTLEVPVLASDIYSHIFFLQKLGQLQRNSSLVLFL